MMYVCNFKLVKIFVVEFMAYRHTHGLDVHFITSIIIIIINIGE